MDEPVKEKEIRTPLSLSQVEEVVRTFARARSIRYGISHELFLVNLVTTLERGYAEYIPGNPVQIVLKWPECQPIIKTVLDSAFRCIVRHRLWRTMEIVPVAFYQNEKKLRKVKFGDISELLELIPKQRLRIKREETLTIRDVKTGESIKVTRSGNDERFEGTELSMWIELSRQINAKYPDPEPATETGTPILDTLEFPAQHPQTRTEESFMDEFAQKETNDESTLSQTDDV